jgi:hypothetical protein
MLAARSPAHGKCLVRMVQVSKPRLGAILGDPRDIRDHAVFQLDRFLRGSSRCKGYVTADAAG